jgi:gamma-glutamyl-gamma-aminobutyrate hydrolase PuuD
MGHIVLFGVTKRISSGPPGVGRRRALVGIPVTTEHARWRCWSDTVFLTTTGYSEHLRRSGAIPVFVPVGGPADEWRQLIDVLDGVLLGGGADVEPHRYGQPPHHAAGPFDSTRDAAEAALVEAVLESGKPVFGICRGLQVLNVVMGGSLFQHVPDVVGTHSHNPTRGAFATHPVHVAADSALHGVIGSSVIVPTYHHQAVDAVAPGLQAVAWTEDGVIEAVEDVGGQIVAVQWHPETDAPNELFEHFVGRCEEHRRFADAYPPESTDSPVGRVPAQRSYTCADT